ncbi:4-alpha-glucanotransferase [Mycolicibacterium brumae]|uniref:4-alpha-glucanotransferase n=1 Tax=Mycolicibacterium brumae TaxID=85968 RepID=A0A2G5PDR1_9MYCO|nr:4-alpha-glucanotransferase [Mycolicibacterium brumae]MCV7192877.1 4-alpha-glucanotransferase [Mycolicibacterium brumae]PIB76459.1 4-alpha-glucanotransferase [Mycolicibacterium brumae]RWA23465.1 hypothetical protein MBRU_01190 [Mycolicibacterium brumae DSM 44177]UWW08604.1 4-alpha-glucanotransferase [Mycolicibacterium brumae]
MTQLEPALAELAGRLGVATGYHDGLGNWVPAPESTLVAVLGALGAPAATAEQRSASAAELDRKRWARPLPPTTVAATGVAPRVWAHVTHGAPATVWVTLEDGGLRRDVTQVDNFTPPFDLDGRLVGEASFELPADLPPGYHRVSLRSTGSEGEWTADAALIITPSWLGLPARVGDRRLWGLSAQLYSVCSKQSWGVGDLTDLTDLAVWSAARHQAGFVLINPLHAAEPVPRMEPSPYLPTSRRFVNPMYLRVEAIPEYAELDKRGPVRRLRQQARRRLRQPGVIDRDVAWPAKRDALKLVYGVKRTAGRELSYAAFRAREGDALDDFAVWCALAEKYGNDWRVWPEELRRPGSPQVAAFARRHPRRVDFHRWLQWLIDEQMANAQSAAIRAGMPLGLMTDLAVGVHPYGADAWALQDVLAVGVNVGAPPDEFNQLGQDWSQPPWRPDRLAETEYEPFRAVIAAALRHAGGVRIDHIIGLFRLWWIPEGALPTAGAYVHYDHEAMIGIVALEAARADALVVGEDLGVVQPWARDYLRARGILGTSILWFETDDWGDGGPLRAEYWREYCLSAVTTHDLPPTAGYLAGEHVALRDQLGLLTRPVAEELAAAAAEQAGWLAELRRVGLLPADGDADEESVVTALYRYLGRTPSRLLTLALTDAVGDRRTQNQPGTSDEYPNWRVPLSDPGGRPMSLEEVFADRRAAALCEVMRSAVLPRN